jgi:hypothetical protein
MNGAASKIKFDLLSVVAVSLLAYTLGLIVHEYMGHALMNVAFGGRLSELGALYIGGNHAVQTSMPVWASKLALLAGALFNAITGVVALILLARLRKASNLSKYWLWLFGTISLLTAAGYVLFSGVSGVGDFGTRAGLFRGVEPEWLVRAVLTVVGAASYAGGIIVSLRRMDQLIGGEGKERVFRAQMLSLTSYLAGSIFLVLVGALNPHGLEILLAGALAYGFGGTCALAWMMQCLSSKKVSSDEPLIITRNWPWIVVSLVIAVAYGLIFGPTIYVS